MMLRALLLETPWNAYRGRETWDPSTAVDLRAYKRAKINPRSGWHWPWYRRRVKILARLQIVETGRIGNL